MTIEKRIERIEAILDARGLDWDHPRVEEEPAKEALLDGLPDLRTFAQPNLRWRILEPGEVVCSSDWVKAKSDFLSDPPSGLGWRPVEISAGMTVCKDDFCVFARPVADEPAKEPEPAWEPKVGDWVRVTRPVDWKEWDHPMWEGSMHEFDGRVGQIDRVQGSGSGIGAMFNIRIRGFVGSDGTQHYWHRNWLSPAEPPEPEYREPVLPGDAGKYCQFSDDGIKWRSGWLNGWVERSHQWIARSGVHWRHCRIKKDA